MTANTDRHPDIEIYVAGISSAQACDWLQTQFSSVTVTSQRGIQTHISARMDQHRVPALVVEKAAGRFTSLWFDSAATPWITDLDCARAAQHYFHREVRCIVSGWQEGDDPDEWWSVSDAGEQLIRWQGA